MSRLEELLELKELIEAEIEELEAEEEILDETLEEITADLMIDLEVAEECEHCVVKRYLRIVYDLAYEDAVNDILEAVEE